MEQWSAKPTLFNIKNNHLYSLSGPIFLFSLDIFKEKLKQFTTPENILNCWEWPSDDNNRWSYLGLSSVIVNCQVKVGRYHQFILRRDLLQTRGTRRSVGLAITCAIQNGFFDWNKLWENYSRFSQFITQCWILKDFQILAEICKENSVSSKFQF